MSVILPSVISAISNTMVPFNSLFKFLIVLQEGQKVHVIDMCLFKQP